MRLSYRRFFTLLSIFFLVTLTLIVRLIYLQIVEVDNLAKGAVKQRTSEIIIADGRGDILDRDGHSLTRMEEEKILVVFPHFVNNEHNFNDIMADFSGEALVFAEDKSSPFIALRGLSSDCLDLLNEQQIPGFILTQRDNRYSKDVFASHLLGHLGPKDREGKVGLEYVFNDELSPELPHTLAAVVDGKSRLIEGIGYRHRGETSSNRPYDLHLTLSLEIQKLVEEVMDKEILQGAVVIMDPQKGDIIAMASRPNYNPDEISDYLNNINNYQEYLSLNPLINRAVLSYSPGSIFKLVVAAAALETGEVSLFDSFYCPGYVQIGDDTFRCSNQFGHGELSFAEGFAHSCNTVFIETALILGRETLYQYALKLGFNQKTGIPLGSAREGGEAQGYIPPPQEMPFLGDLALTAIGQGKVAATPLQIARLTSIIANGGKNTYPLLVQSINCNQGHEIQTYSPVGQASQVLSSETIQQLKFMMMGVTTYGTGQDAFAQYYPVGGKTGTAETGRVINGQKETLSWFTGIVPIDNPRIVITVFIEQGKDKSAAAVFQLIQEKVAGKL